MEQSLSISEKASAASLYLFGLLLFVIPFNVGVLVPTLYLWVLVTIVSYFFVKDYSLKDFRILLLLPPFFILLHLARAIFFGSLKAEMSDFETKLSLFLVPLVFPYTRETFLLNRNNLLVAFLLGNAAALISCFGVALYRSLSYVDGLLYFTPNITEFDNFFFGANFSFLLHPSYFSLYINICFLILFALRKDLFKTKLIKFFWSLLAVLFFISLLLLNSRVGMLTFFLLIIGLSVRSIIVKKRIVAGVLLLVIIFSMLFFIPRFGEKQFRAIHSNAIQKIETGFLSRMSLKYYLTVQSVKDMFETKKLPEWKEDWTTMRAYIWKGSLGLIARNAWVGIGPNSIRPALTKFYQDEGIAYAVANKLNCHNQFLETFLGIGILGFLFLLALIIVPSVYAYYQKNWFFLGFMVFFLILFTVESAFNRIAGVASFSVFFSFFLSYFGLVTHKGNHLSSIN